MSCFNNNVNEYMKRYCYIVIFAWIMAACNISGANVNPNASPEAPAGALLSGAEATLAFSLGVDAGLITGIFMQQLNGANGDATSMDNYTSGPARYNAVWTSFYFTALTNLRLLQQQALRDQQPYYSGISRILQTYAYSTLTTLFGDIPYSNSLQQRDNLTPVYEPQTAIYPALQLQLDTAIQELSRTADDNKGPVPAADDLIYNGDVRKWTAAAWTLKARLAIHLSKKEGSASARRVLAYLYNNGVYRGIPEARQDAVVNFGTAATNANPFYQQNVTRPGWIGLGAAFVNLLNGNEVKDPAGKVPAATADPRRAFFATPFPAASGQYRGGVAGVPGAYSLIGSHYGTPVSPVVLISFTEAKLLEAEARIRLNPQDPLAQHALQDAVKASFGKVILNNGDPFSTPEKQAAYITAKATLKGNFTADLTTIITQKYIALFLQPEVWTDYRRTGFPDIPPAQNATHGLNPNGNIPRRFPYPQNEQSLNRNTPSPSGYQSPRLWWDQ